MRTSKTKSKQKELLVKSRTENLATVREFVNSAVGEVSIPQDIAGDIVLAVDEACTNIIKHAYQYSPDGDIKIKLKYSDKKF